MEKIQIISPEIPNGLEGMLRELNCRIIATKEQKNLPAPERFHADLQAFAPDSHTLIAAPGVFDYYREALQGTGIAVLRGNADPGEHYPQRIAYNVARVKDRAYCLTEAVDPVIAEELRKRGVALVNVTQGYAACSLVPVGAGIITSDKGIAEKAKDCLFFDPKQITLPGYENGLIGGCFCRIGEELSVLCGDPSLCDRGDALTEFFARHGVMLKTVAGQPLFDFGGSIFLEGM